MPARTDGASVKPVTAVPTKRFELPALNFKFDSLTEGTDIPPPLPSPIFEEPSAEPHTPTEGDKETAGVANGHSKAANGKVSTSSPESTATKTTTNGIKRPADDNPSSPTLSNRQGSIRRLFSRNLLNNAYEEGAVGALNGIDRPESRTGSYIDPKKAKRSSGWFSRLRSSDAASKRASVVAPSPTLDEKPKPKGPPPPMIPELNELKSKIDVLDEGSLGNDLFKDIKIDPTF